MNNDPQRDLFPEETLVTEANQKRPPISQEASLQAALGVFEIHMRDEGFSINTMKAFSSDVRLLGKYLGVGQPVGEIGTKNLNDFLDWLLNERGVPCSPKSYARRVTTLKVFFGWLHDSGVLADDPSSAVIQRTVTSPLPVLPSEDQIADSLTQTLSIRNGEGVKKPDARPHLLLTLLLKTGIKKSEAMTVVPNHIDRSDPDQPMLFIRYANPRLRYKERKLYLDPSWLETLDEYLDQYRPSDTLFTCTARNLEYILTDAGEAVGLHQGLLSFENLRWVSALRDWDAGVEKDDIRQKLGLSKVTWRETKSKLTKLAAQREARQK
ncbi:MAG: phage integrase N-terminal SAM-like domain-containing protein [Anaerolineaceae bacterium]|nr:MAG: phage integrase N-terminal SAM-like domain-containing protein [Anaerolineaceae bacterium]